MVQLGVNTPEEIRRICQSEDCMIIQVVYDLGQLKLDLNTVEF